MASPEQLQQDLKHEEASRIKSFAAAGFWTIAEGFLFINSALDILSVKQPDNVWFAILVLKIGFGIIADRFASIDVENFHASGQEVKRLKNVLGASRRDSNNAIEE